MSDKDSEINASKTVKTSKEVENKKVNIFYLTIGITITWILFISLIIVLAIFLIKAVPEKTSDWFTFLGTPISILLGIFSIVAAEKAKEAAKEATKAIRQKYENKEKEEIYSQILNKSDNCSQKITTWIYQKNTEDKTDVANLISEIESITRTIRKEHLLSNDNEINELFKKIIDQVANIESYVDLDNNTVKEGKESDLKKEKKGLQDNLDDLYSICKDRKGELYND